VLKTLFKQWTAPKSSGPTMLGLKLGQTFKIERPPSECRFDASTSVEIQRAGLIKGDNCTVLRFYYEDADFIQLTFKDGLEREHLDAVCLFELARTQDLANDELWNHAINQELATSNHSIAEQSFVSANSGPLESEEHLYFQDAPHQISWELRRCYQAVDTADSHHTLLARVTANEVIPGCLARTLSFFRGYSLEIDQLQIDH